jgi:hypothetical protein
MWRNQQICSTRNTDSRVHVDPGASWHALMGSRRLSRHVLRVEGADHGLYVPCPLSDSIEVLGHVVVAVEEFLDTINWAT